MPKGFPKPCPQTLDWLDDWEPEEPAIQYEAEQIRGSDAAMRVSQAVGVSLKECGHTREKVARMMTEYLGHDVPKSALDAWAAPGRERDIPHKDLVALAVVLQDWRLLSVGAEEVDCIIIPRQYEELIKLAVTIEKARKLEEDIATKRSILRDLGIVTP
jgi:hypothetical protein